MASDLHDWQPDRLVSPSLNATKTTKYYGVTVKTGPVAGTPEIVTTMLPVVAPEGTETAMLVPFEFHEVI
jgi:hypothetical protein